MRIGIGLVFEFAEEVLRIGIGNAAIDPVVKRASYFFFVLRRRQIGEVRFLQNEVKEAVLQFVTINYESLANYVVVDSVIRFVR